MALARTLAALALTAMMAAPAMAFDASFDFSNVRPCAGGVLHVTPSPQFTLTDVPDGTATLDFSLVDLTIDYPHGSRQMAYAGTPVIAADSFKYVGPCPDFEVTHSYQWTIRALDAAKVELGVARAKGDFTGSR